jgi:hypothetical protein
LLLCAHGCTPFTQTLATTAWWAQRPLLPRIKPPPDAIALEFVFVDRPAGDKLVGEALWRHVDEVTSLTPDVRFALNRNGLRMGVAGQQPTPALQTLLGFQSDFVYEPDAEKLKRVNGQRIYIRSGGENIVQVTDVYPACFFHLHERDEQKALQYDTVQGALLVRAFRMPDGWARIEITPQLSFDDPRTGWREDFPQEYERYPRLTSSFRLSTGEMLIVSCTDDSPNTLGSVLFHGGQTNPDVQRLLIIRVAEILYEDRPGKPR